MKLEGKKCMILMCLIRDAKLYRLHLAPVLLAETNKGDVCVWNYQTGQILAMIDAREGKLSLHRDCATRD